MEKDVSHCREKGGGGARLYERQVEKRVRLPFMTRQFLRY